MAEDNFKNMLFAFILVAVFGMLIMTAVVEVGNTYSMDTSEVAGGSLSINRFNESISDVETIVQNQKSIFDEQGIWSALVGIVVEGIFGIAGALFNMILMPFDLITDIMIDVLGVPAWLTVVLLSLLTISIMLGIWRLIKIGD